MVNFLRDDGRNDLEVVGRLLVADALDRGYAVLLPIGEHVGHEGFAQLVP
jgi:hypothetical protein